MESFLLILLIVLAVPFVLPIVAWVSARNTRARLIALEDTLERNRVEIDQLRSRLNQLTPRERQPAADARRDPVARPAPPAPVPTPTSVPTPAPVAAPPPAAPPRPSAPPVATPPAPPTPSTRPAPASTPVPAPKPTPAVPSSAPVPPRVVTPSPTAAPPQPVAARTAAPTPPARTPPRPPSPPAPPTPPAPSFDWESLIGVKLFSAIAGIAMVIAAVFFLKYAADAGWLQPPVRVAIGVLVALTLLVLCELKAARKYPATANAMDAAAIAILFATFFAAHALWNLVPAVATFALLGVVTILAVLLSIRRESLFIAVLGLLGGFATPILLSTGENRPIPLFAYLLLLNIGLAWVAYSKGWPILSWLTLACTALYQWGWVFKFLDVSSLPLAMGIFLVFPVAAVAGMILGPRRGPSGSADGRFEHSALVSSVLPLLFAVYLAGTPAYAAHAALLFGFLLLIDIGLLAIAIARGEEILHAMGAVTTMVVMAVWLKSYDAFGTSTEALAFTSMFVLLYVAAPVVAGWFGRRFTGVGRQADYAGPMLLFVFPVLAQVEPATANPWPLMTTLAGLVILIAWRAVASGMGPLYYVAAFYAIAAQGVWSANHLTIDRLSTAVAIYTIFGVVSLAVPMLARRESRPLEPQWGSGAVLICSLGLLLFLSTGPIAPAAIWALALLLAIMNAGLFVESAAGRLPMVSQIGSVLSWAILVVWWLRAAGSVGVFPSLTVLVGLTLVTLAGHAWSARRARTAAWSTDAPQFAQGVFLGLTGHLFLALLAANRTWSLPPWPLFAALTVLTLAVSAASLWSGVPALHVAGAIAAAVVMAVWSGAAGSPAWGTIAVLAQAAVSAYALLWIAISDRDRMRSAAAACATLFAGEIALVLAIEGHTTPPFAALVAAHAANIAIVLALTTAFRWPYVAVAAVLPAWVVIMQWQTRVDLDVTWRQLLVLSGTLYAVFAAYPFVAAGRAKDDRDPYFAAIAASAMAFFGARAAFVAGGLDSIIGIVPVVEGAVLAAMLRGLLRIESAGKRDLGRLALVAGAALAFVTVAIPLQLSHQWITIGWALEGAALAWLYRRIPHKGLLLGAVGLLGAVFVRLALNEDVFLYEPRGTTPIFNWYLYTYAICAVAMFLAGWWLSRTEDTLIGGVRTSHTMSAAGVILLFILLNIEIADFYATGPTIMFRFGATVSQDLTYTIGWLLFGMGLLAAGIYLHTRAARVAAVTLIAVTTFKCFLYDLSSLEGLHRVASFVGLAISLALVSLALQRFVLSKPRSAES
jgi:uncharacterized membrane protein